MGVTKGVADGEPDGAAGAHFALAAVHARSACLNDWVAPTISIASQTVRGQGQA